MPPEAALPRYRSKTTAAWLALLAGGFGAHRFYLKGARDRAGWCFPLPTLIGLAGALRLKNIGLDDGIGALLVPVGGIALSVALLTAIVYALMPDEKWDARFNGGRSGQPSGWAAVFAAIVGLFAGTVVLISTIAYGGQRLFEMERDAAPPAADTGR